MKIILYYGKENGVRSGIQANTQNLGIGIRLKQKPTSSMLKLNRSIYFCLHSKPI